VLKRGGLVVPAMEGGQGDTQAAKNGCRGGTFGLKGTDGQMYEKALELGAKPVAPKRTRDLLSHIEHKDKITLLVALSNMGEEYVKGYEIAFTVIGRVGSETSAEDTKRISMDGLKNPDYMRRNVQRLIEQRDRVWRALNELGSRRTPKYHRFPAHEDRDS